MRLIARRIALYVATTVVAITINFFLPRLMPGNPSPGRRPPVNESAAADPLPLISQVNGCACAGPNPLIWVTLAHPGER